MSDRSLPHLLTDRSLLRHTPDPPSGDEQHAGEPGDLAREVLAGELGEFEIEREPDPPPSRPGGHPERPARLTAVLDAFADAGFAEGEHVRSFLPAGDDDLLRVHAEGYLLHLAETVPGRRGNLDPDTYYSPDSLAVARTAAGAAVEAVRLVCEAGDDAPKSQRRAFCAIRPPGHHALADRAMGFCLLGNAAIAAAYARDECGLDRVLVVDFDVHHGNGTQAMFYDRGEIGFASMHRSPFWPFSGEEHETGSGDGLGATFNLPIELGTPREEIRERFARLATDAAARLKPQLVIVSAGFDAHRRDPVGSLGLQTEDFAALTDTVVGLAEEHAGGRIVSLLEGGYDLPALAESSVLHFRRLTEAHR